jgi:hypothetical protein
VIALNEHRTQGLARGAARASRQVIVLGFDSADADLIIGWVNDGILPNFGKLLSQAAWGRIDNDLGNVAGTAWQSFHTGVWPGRHGYYEGTKHFNPETYEDGTEFADRKDVPRELIWEILGRNGHRVAVIDAPHIFFPSSINGLILDSWGAHDRHAPPGQRVNFQAAPADLRSEVLARYGEDPLGMHEVACDAFKPRNVKELVWLRDALIRRTET